MKAIRKTLTTLQAAGVREVAIVEGRHAEQLRVQLELHEFAHLHVRVFSNLPGKYETGSALLAAAKWVEDGKRCLVLRGDRVLTQGALESLVAADRRDRDRCDATLVVAARGSGWGVALDESLVRAFDEDLADADALFVGHALVNAAILEALGKLANPTLEDGLLALVEAGRVAAVHGDDCMPAATDSASALPNVIALNVGELMKAKRQQQYTLLNPGPVNTTATVKSALIHHDVCHRDPTFSDLMLSLTRKLRRIFRATPEHSILLLTGSGTAAMESALVSTVPPDRKLLVIDNGAFGERLVEVASVHEMDVVHLRYDWGTVVDPADVERALAADPEIGVVAMIHHETSVGILNPVREIGELCRRHDVLLVVDAVSSIGAEDLDVVRDNIDVCYSSANKCLHAVSGASMICVAPHVWPRIAAYKPRAYYLDIRRYRRYMDELAQTPFTPAVSTYFALDAACSEFLEDGHEARLAMYAERNALLRAGLEALGMPSYTHTGMESHSIVTCRLPQGVAFEDLYNAVKERGVILYGSKGVLAKDNCMQVANMGDITTDDIVRALAIIGAELDRLRGGSRKIAWSSAAARRTG